jgi:hypothetical protein
MNSSRQVLLVGENGKSFMSKCGHHGRRQRQIPLRRPDRRQQRGAGNPG